MKRVALLAATTSVFAIVWAAGHPKATGTAYFEAYGRPTYVSFNAHDMGEPMDDKGWFAWKRTGDMYENEFGGPVINAHVDPLMKCAYFDVRIEYSVNFPTWTGEVIRFYVKDMGTPGRNGDQIRWVWQNGWGDSGWWPITGGNMVVHPK